MATPGFRTNNGQRPTRTMQQQRNVDMKRGDTHAYDAQNRQGTDGRKYGKGKVTPAGQIPGGPNKLQQAQAAYGAANTPIKKPGMFAKFHTAVGRQFKRSA